jgi:hypothetical protein
MHPLKVVLPSVMESFNVAELPATATLPVRSRTKHTIQSPTCHPPSMLDFMMDGQKMSICSEAYASYASIWKDCIGGKVFIPGTSRNQMIPVDD